VDPSSKPIIVDSDEGCRDHNHLHADVFNSDLPTILGNSTEHRSFDVAVCNPPYFVPQWRNDFKEILGEAGLLPAFHASTELPAEVIFMAQNLRLLESGGQIGIIVPDGLISGRKMECFRRLLTTTFHIEMVVQLPVNVFRKAEATTFLLILEKAQARTETLALRKLNDNGILTRLLPFRRSRALVVLTMIFTSPGAL
jgi:type I restriction enzyme M protein